MATQKRSAKKQSSPETPKAARPKRVRKVGATPRRAKAKTASSGAIARKLIKDNPRALSVPEWLKDKSRTVEPLPRVGTAASTLLIVAARVVGYGRDLLEKVRRH